MGTYVTSIIESHYCEDNNMITRSSCAKRRELNVIAARNNKQ